MFSHVHVGISDFERAFAFYAPIMRELGAGLKFRDPERAWAGWMPQDLGRPLFLIGHPYDGRPPQPGNGAMTAFLATSRAQVDECHRLALAMGGYCEGEPGLRPHYHPDYYGAYFRDLDGNKICVCCHAPAAV